VFSVRKRDKFILFVETILIKRIPHQKEQSFSTQKLFAKEQSFFFTFFLFFSSSEKNDHIFETKVHLVLTQLRERSVDDTNTTYSE